MIKFVLVAFTGLFFAFSASADPIFGLWQTVGDDNGNYGQIEVKAFDKLRKRIKSIADTEI